MLGACEEVFCLYEAECLPGVVASKPSLPHGPLRPATREVGPTRQERTDGSVSQAVDTLSGLDPKAWCRAISSDSSKDMLQLCMISS
jgi:hypothetical protein